MPFTKADLPPLDPEPEETDFMEEESDGDVSDTPAAETGTDGAADGGATSTGDNSDATGDRGAGAGETDAANSADSGNQDDAAGTEPSELAEAAQKWQNFQNNYIRDPVAMMKAFLSGMTPQDQARFVEQAQQVSQPAATPWGENSSDAEDWLSNHVAAIEGIPQLARGIEQELTMRDHFINDHDVRLATMEACIEALSEFLEIQLPKLDAKALAKALDGNTNNLTAIGKVYKPAVKQAVLNKKQANKPRPQTPGNAANAHPNVEGVKSMAAIMRQISGK